MSDWNNMIDTAGTRLVTLRKGRNLSKVAVARAINVSDVAVGYWERDLNKPGGESLTRLAKLYGVSEAYILHGDTSAPSTNIEPPQVSKIPILTSEDVKKWNVELGTSGSSSTFGYIYTDTTMALGAFAIKLKERSMEPEFVDGDLVIIDPQLAPLPGDYVVAMDSANNVIFKKYRAKGLNPNQEPIFELLPTNPDFPINSSENETLTIIGVMVEHRRFRRR